MTCEYRSFFDRVPSLSSLAVQIEKQRIRSLQIVTIGIATNTSLSDMMRRSEARAMLGVTQI